MSRKWHKWYRQGGWTEGFKCSECGETSHQTETYPSPARNGQGQGIGYRVVPVVGCERP